MLTAEELTAWYPPFAAFTPAIVLTGILEQANARFGDFGADAGEARRLYAAHKLTLYSRAAARGGETGGRVTGKKVGEVQIAYASAGSAQSAFADLTETAYGLELLSLLRLHGRSRYVP